MDSTKRTVTECIRQHLWDTLDKKMPDLEILRQTEWSSAFEQCMRNRLIMGSFRYGRFCSRDKWTYDMLAGMEKKLAAYRESGNTENLVDIANYALLEFHHPSHPEAHFHAEDDHSHCPRVTDTGTPPLAEREPRLKEAFRAEQRAIDDLKRTPP